MAAEIWRFIKDRNILVNNGEAMMPAPIAGANERASLFSSRLAAAAPSALTLNPMSKVCAANAG
jgi:hypothetical protein